MGPTALLPLRRKCALQIFITHKIQPSLAGPEPTAVSPIVPMASMLTTRLYSGNIRKILHRWHSSTHSTWEYKNNEYCTSHATRKSVAQKHKDQCPLFSKSDITMTGFLNVVFISGRKAVVQDPVITVLENYEKCEILYKDTSTKTQVQWM
jgi:hypothetical protein